MAFYGLDWIATVPPTVTLVTQTFGDESGLVVYGWVFAAHQIGAAVVALFAGAIRDHATRGFLLFRLLFIIGGVRVFPLRGANQGGPLNPRGRPH